MQDQACGAKTRAGHPCRRQGRGKGGRCANHGGESTGPRTEEGRRQISETQKARWAAWRAARGKMRVGDDKRLWAASKRYESPELEDLYAEDLG